MEKLKFLLIITLITTLCHSQFSSFVSSYLLKKSTDLITPVEIVQQLDEYISYKSADYLNIKAGETQITSTATKSIQINEKIQMQLSPDKKTVCIFPFIIVNRTCSCPANLINVSGKCMRAPLKSNLTLPNTTSQNKNPNKIVCPLLKINIKKKTGFLEDLAFISRTYDGTNNNQENQDWGSAGSFLQRRVISNYIDGISQPVNSFPSPRVISNLIGSQTNVTKSSRTNATILFCIFGQFVDHDIGLTINQPPTGQEMNIVIPKDDTFFTNQTFMKFMRSKFVQFQDGPRRHKNQITSWIDGSQIYGSDNDTNCALRTYKNGKMKTSIQSNKDEFLPFKDGFYKAGDVRAIENSILISIHTIFHRKIPAILRNGTIEKQYLLSDIFLKQDIIDSKFISNILRGASRTKTKQKNPEFVDDVRNLLVLDPFNRQVKLDLFAINMQRGRDHGLAHYNDARLAFGLPRIQTFEELVPDDQIELAEKLKSIYGTPDNLQLYLGIICQKPLQNAILGELGAVVVGQTFRNLRDADRFWYERVYPPSVIDEIDTTQLGDIIRRNSGAKDIPSNVFIYDKE